MDLFGEAKKFVDKNTKDLQKGAQQIIDQTRNVIDQNTDTLTKPLFGGPINLSGTNGGGKSAPSYNLADAAQKVDFSGITKNLETVTKPVEQAVETVTAPVVQAVEQVAKPVEQAVKTAGVTIPKIFGGTPVVQAVEQVTSPVGISIPKVLGGTPVVKAVEQTVSPVGISVPKIFGGVEQVAQTAVQAVTPVVESVVDVAKVPVQAVEQITKIDAPKVVESVAKETILAPVKVAETVVKAAEPVVKAATQVVQQPVKAVEEIAKIDVPKVVENVVKQAATTVTEAPKMVVEIAENAVLKPASNLSMYLKDEAKNALELTWDNIISPFQPGETKGTVAEEPAAADLDAKDFTGNDDPFGNIETATTKADKMTEEERLRRIRRLMLNRYGREDTILTGAKDPLNRRRYASAL